MTTPPDPPGDDPLEPPEYPEAASEEERNRLRWAWRDGFEAGAQWTRGQIAGPIKQVKTDLAEIKTDLAEHLRRPVPWQEVRERDHPTR